MLANYLSGRETVYLGHFTVKNHESERFAILVRRSQGSQRDFSAIGAARLHPPIRKRLRKDETVGPVVVDHQNRQTFERGRFEHGNPPGPGFELRREMKGATGTAFRPPLRGPGALDPDVTLHQFHQLDRNRETKPRSTVAARDGSIGLLEGREDMCLLVRRDADTSVGDHEMQGVERAIRFLPGNLDRHPAPIGELESVANQVQENLPQPARVADQYLGNIRANIHGELNAFLGRPDREQPQAIADAVGEVELYRVQFVLSRLDLRK